MANQDGKNQHPPSGSIQAVTACRRPLEPFPSIRSVPQRDTSELRVTADVVQAIDHVFMTRRDALATIHEPFGDAFYYGPERMSSRFEKDEEARANSGFSKSTYKTIFDAIAREGSKGKRIFIKDITHYLVPPDGKPATIAPSLIPKRKGVGTDAETNGIQTQGQLNGELNNGHAINGMHKETPFPYETPAESGNPTVIPSDMLRQFHFAFLIRDPHNSISSYYRCTIPPLDKISGFYNFCPSEAGYDELRRFFDYLKSTGQIGPSQAKLVNGQTNGNVTNGAASAPEICMIDADDLLDDPEAIIEAFCKSVGIDYDPGMLTWDTEEEHNHAKHVFAKWKGFHEDAIDSEDLKPRKSNKKERSEAEWDAVWKEKYGEKGAMIIRETVDAQMEHYLYLKQFAIKV